MNQQLQLVLDIVQHNENLTAEEKTMLLKAIKNADSELTISEFKLQRTEKVKRTTSILLEETIDELELKRKAIEDSNIALQQSLKDLKSAQAQLIQSEKMASLGELTAGIAHEIQNPLNFVNNFSDVNIELVIETIEEINNGDLNEAIAILSDIQSNEEKINHHGKRADSIVKGMLQHSRTSAGEKVSTDINSLCDEYLRLSYHGLRAKDSSFNATMDTQLSPNLPHINVIPQDIGRVLLNLFNNAFYAVNERSKKEEVNYSPKVTITTKGSEEAIVISVEDNGVGIPDSIKKKIFNPFFTTKPTGQGTGLGLSLSYDIIKAHGGTIELESITGTGTSFTILLPLSNS